MFHEWPCGGTSSTDIIDITSVPQSSKPIDHSPPVSLFHQSPSPPSLAQPKVSKRLKRSRSIEGIDNEGDEPTQRKKRRLRIDLVTSRLSRPYADPATHIIGTKSWRAGAWARQKFAGGKLLQKAAVLNWMAFKQGNSPVERMRVGEYRNKNAFCGLDASSMGNQLSQASVVTPKAPVVSFDYDALDYQEDDIGQEEEEEDGDSTLSSDEDGQAIHSDFRSLEASDTDPQFFDTSWSFVDIGDREPHSKGKEIKLVIENETKNEVSVAPTRVRDFTSLSARAPATAI